MYDKAKLAEDVLMYRAIHNLDQKELAKKCGVSRETINLIENEKTNLRRVNYYKIINVIGGKSESK